MNLFDKWANSAEGLLLSVRVDPKSHPRAWRSPDPRRLVACLASAVLLDACAHVALASCLGALACGASTYRAFLLFLLCC